MNTKPIPIIMALSASGVCCIISILQDVPFGVFVTRFGVVAFIFFVLGALVGTFLLEAFGPPVDEKEKEKAAADAQNDEQAASDEGVSVPGGDGVVSSMTEEMPEGDEEIPNINTNLDPGQESDDGLFEEDIDEDPGVDGGFPEDEGEQ